MTALCSATKSATWLHRAQSVVPVSMENRSTMRVYAQDESPIRHNLLDAANHKRTSKAMMLPLHIGTGGVELKVDEFVPKTYRKYASSLPSVPACPVVPTKDIPSPSVATEIPEEKFPGTLTEKPDMESTRTSVNVVPVAPTATTSDLLGRSVRKFFDGFGWYDGKVTSRWESLDYGEQFHVVYTDGDSEDLTLDMLSPLLQPTSPIRLATEPSAVSRPCVADGVQGKGVDLPAISDWRSDDYVRRKRSSDALSSSSSWQEPHQVQSRRPPIDNSLVPPPKLHFQHRRHDMTAALPNQRPQPLGRAPNLLARLPSMMPANGGPPPPIAVFNDMLYDAIQRATTVESFGRKFVRVLLDDPQYDNVYYSSPLSVRCGQRRYRMLERFMEDVWLLSDTAKHMFPVDKALHDQAAAFVSALSNVLRELKVPLRALQGQLT
ncbi:hypothetical protein DYB28_001568 [Aphanomyces astaci]|uniref:PTM/DIR17-like Tudor domain-containing protein n=1 Tax=Aphanomyces astaci TaxID=112090 RepID=A0A9X8HC01_APHAT|nr:hypothetical protein DYB28_001568 [Aphanomyces astaci]